MSRVNFGQESVDNNSIMELTTEDTEKKEERNRQ